MLSDLAKAIADLKEEEALRLTKQKLDSGVDPLKIIEDGRNAMEIVGKRFEGGEYFVADLVYSGDILQEIAKIVKPKLTKITTVKRLGKFVIGTVAGDIHDIGKNIVSLMMDLNGFEVYDLGVDVPSQKFVEKVKEVKPELLGLSGLLTVTYDSMKETIEAIKTAGLRNRVKIIIGGCLVNEKIREYTGADAYGPDAIAAVTLAKKWIRGE